MKKLVLISTIMATLAGMSAFGQGYFIFATGKSQVYDGFSTGASHTSASVDVSFLWGAAGMTPMVSSIAASVPTTATSGNSLWLASTAWNDILHDPNFQLAQNGSNVVVTTSLATGALSYNGGSAFAGTGTTAGTPYACFMISWDGTYANPLAAAAANGGAGAYVGWSAVFAYTPSTITGIPSNMIGLTPAFGTAGVIPEPATLALIGLGGLSLLAFRRRS